MEITEIQIVYFVEKYGHFYKDTVDWGVLKEFYPDTETAYVDIYRINKECNRGDIHRLEFDNPTHLKEAIIIEALTRGRYFQQNFNYELIYHIRTSTKHIFYTYDGATKFIKEENDKINRQLTKINNMSNYDYSMMILKRDFKHKHLPSSIESFITNYIRDNDLQNFELRTANGILTLHDLTSQIAPHYDYKNDKTIDICGFTDKGIVTSQFKHKLNYIESMKPSKIKKNDKLREKIDCYINKLIERERLSE